MPAVLENFTNNRNSNDLLGLINTFTVALSTTLPFLHWGSCLISQPPLLSSYLDLLCLTSSASSKRRRIRRKKLNQMTRLLTVAITLVQGGAYLTYIKSIGAISPNIPVGIFWFSSIIILSTGTIFAMWLGERITDKGIGNGISMIIMVGIIARLPQAILFEFQSQVNVGGLLLFVLELAGFFFVTMLCILIVQGVRRIPIQFAKRMVGRGNSNIPQSGNRDYIPLKVNAAGVMPIIFAQAIIFLPITVAQYLIGSDGQGGAGSFLASLQDPFSTTTAVFSFIMVVAFTYIYTALVVNPQQYAEYLKRQECLYSRHQARKGNR
jgi:preprotein translocase subunit SecY